MVNSVYSMSIYVYNSNAGRDSAARPWRPPAVPQHDAPWRGPRLQHPPHVRWAFRCREDVHRATPDGP